MSPSDTTPRMTSETGTAQSAQAPVIMYGKPVATEIRARVAAEVPGFVSRYKVAPRLAIVQVGSNPASNRYVKKKIEACAAIGMEAELHQFDEAITGDGLKEEVDKLSRDKAVHGILVQLPLPRRIEEPEDGYTSKFDIFDVIAPEKDVDGIGQTAVTGLYRAQQDKMTFLACTALAVRRMMQFYKVRTQGKLAVVIGRNDITAKPIMHMLGGRMCNAAAIWCHRYVPLADQHRLMRQADIIVSSVGSVHYRITRDMVKPGAVIFDIATRVTPEGKLAGDVDFPAVKDVVSHITPVPGGVGPVTVAALIENLLRAAKFSVGADAYGYTF